MTVSYAYRVLSEPYQTRMTSGHIANSMTTTSFNPVPSLYPSLFEASAPTPMTQEEAP